LKVRDILDLLRSEGWFICRTRGSHRQLKHERFPGTVTVAGPPNHDLHPKILGRIRQQASLGSEAPPKVDRAFDPIDKP
jgi:predicted RNA binding protein YcfA (HicA-like mRNA interferase family)